MIVDQFFFKSKQKQKNMKPLGAHIYHLLLQKIELQEGKQMLFYH